MSIKKWIILSAILILSACKDKNNANGAADDHPVTVEKEITGDIDQWGGNRQYQDSIYHIGFRYPAGLEVYRGELMPNAPVINVYPKGSKQSPPFGIHEDPELGYIAVLPRGFGVDAPAGRSEALKDREESPPVDLSINSAESKVFLLENGEPWAYSIRFLDNVENWNDYGSIFVRLGVNNFRATCEEQEDGEKVKMEDCDPLAGDVIKYYGEIKEQEANLILETLQSIYFISPGQEREKIAELIKVTEPAENEKISSPLQIRGKAKGYWFFEADAPFLIVNDNNKVLSRGSVTAEGDWMTEDWVPFTATAEFNAVGSEAGYIIFQRSNASGKPEHDRSYRLPVRF